MKRSVSLIAAACAFLPALASAQTIIQMTDTGFVPNSVTINRGGTVVFESTGTEDHWPASNPHPVHTIYSEFDSRHPILPGATWSFTFTSGGTWYFHDHLFPNFTGTITVGEGSGSTSSVISQSRQVSHWWSSFVPGLASFWKSITSRATEPRHASFATTNPSAADVDVLYRDWKFPCSDHDFSCASGVIMQITAMHGPRVAVAFLKRLQQENKIDLSVDDHQLAHRIGRETARVFGETGDAFRMCPMSDYNGGCQHGFFEYVLGRTTTTADAAEKICRPMKDSFSAKVYFDCYHGVGHGVMMAQAYDLPASLAICDSLGDSVGQEGCWQGVFMENVNGAMTGASRPGVFSNEDPLLPCTVIDKKYQHECFINQFGWLMRVAGNSVSSAARSCLAAPSDQRGACLQSIGLAVTNPTWQISLTPKGDNLVVNAWHICQEFPEGHVDQCIIGAIDNLMNFDQFNTARSGAFCDTISPSMRDVCYRQIGINVRRQATQSTDVAILCGALPGKNACLQGAGITPGQKLLP